MASLGAYEGFYPSIVKDPGAFVRKRERVAEMLIELKKRGKGLFLATNSCYDFCDLIMTTAYGADWRRLFDICVTNTAKPEFFRSTAAPFLKLDTSKFLFCGEPAKSPLEIGGQYVKGNYKRIEEAFEAHFGRKGLRYLYIGDHYLNDCLCARKVPGWSAVAIVEELSRIFQREIRFR